MGSAPRSYHGTMPTRITRNTCVRDMVAKCVNRNENYMDVFALYSHTMSVSILSSLTSWQREFVVSWEAIAGFSSAIIAVCALGLTVCQARITRRYNKLSVTPHLTTWTQSEQVASRYSVEILNNGIGPALIKSFSVQVDGQPIGGEGSEPIEKALKVLFPQYLFHPSQGYMARGYMMSPKEARSLVAVQFFGERIPRQEEVDHVMKRTRLLIEYEWIYGDKQLFDTDAKA